jgi:hypothetical protein
LLAPGSNVTPDVDITTYWQKSRSNRVDYKNNVAASALSLSLNVLEKAELSEPAVLDIKPYAKY